MGLGVENGGNSETIGTEGYPAVKIDLRVSIVRSTEHRSIDISMEAAGVGPDGRRRSWPAQLFSLQ
jgi:protein arginine N-methyltransferase 3